MTTTNVSKKLGRVPVKYFKTLEETHKILAPTLDKIAEEARHVDWSEESSGDILFTRRNKLSGSLHKTAVGLKRQAESLIFKGVKEVEEFKKSLNSHDKEDFDILYIDGSNQGVWKEDADMDKLGASDATRKAYKAFRKSLDDAYVTNNYHLRADLDRRGWKYDSKTDNIVKKEDHRTVASKEYNKMVIKMSKGDNLTFKNTSVEDLKKKYLDTGEFELVRVHPSSVVNGGLDYTHMLIPASKKLEDLPTFVLPYKAGGVRMYTKNTHFVKIGNIFRNEKGVKFLGYAKTLIAGSDVKRLQKYADDVNTVLKIYQDYSNDLYKMQKALDEADLTEFKITTVSDLLGLIKTADNPDGILDPDLSVSKAKVYRLNEKFVYDVDKTKQDYMIIDNLDGYDAELSALMQHQRQYYRSRGDEIIENINNKSKDHVVDPFQIWQTNIIHAANEGILGTLYREMGEDFKARYADVIDPDLNLNAMSGEEVIQVASIVAPNSYYNAKARAAARMQATYKALKNTPTKMDELLNKWISSSIESLPKDWWDNKYVEYLRHTKPIEFANAVIFRAYLGMFNIQQLFKNGVLPIINMVTLDPRVAFKALGAVPSVVLAHLNKDNKTLFNRAVMASGLTEEEMHKFLNFVEEYGTLKQLSQRPEISAGGYAMSKKWPEADLIFLKSATNSAQLVADLIAFLKFGGEDLNKVAGYADDLMSNSSRVNTSTFQRSSIGRLVGTFTSYPISVMEALTGKHFTKDQKIRFAFCQFAMWGFGGTVSRDMTSNMYSWLEEHDLIENETIRSILIDGVFTHLAAVAGYDIREGADIGGMFNQLMATVPVLADMFGIAPDVPTGNAISIMADTYKTVKEIISPSSGVRDYLAWARNTASRSHAPTSVRSLANFVIAKSANEFWNKHGDILIKNVDDAKAFNILMGFKPVEGRLAQMNYEMNKIIEDGITELFEDTVKPVLRDLNTFKRTGKGKTELSLERVTERRELHQKYLTNVRQFMSVIKESYPEYKGFAQTLINNEADRGKETFKQSYVEDLTEKNKQFLGVQE